MPDKITQGYKIKMDWANLKIKFGGIWQLPAVYKCRGILAYM